MGICRSKTNPHITSNHTTKKFNMESMTEGQFRIGITNATSPIGLAIIAALEKNFPQHCIRAGIPHEIYHNKMDEMITKHDVVVLNPAKRQSLIWSFVGIDALLIVPSFDIRLHTTLSYIAAAKAAGVKLITVVSCPTRHSDGLLSYSNTPDAVERAVLRTKLGCCFVRLPFILDRQEFQQGKYTASIPLSACVMSGVAGHDSPSKSRVASISLVDVGCACASILANYKDHMFTRYDLFIRPDKDSNEQTIDGPSKSPAYNQTLANSPHVLPTSPDVQAVLSNTHSPSSTPVQSPSPSPLASGLSIGSDSDINEGNDSGLSSESNSEAGSLPNSAPTSTTNQIPTKYPQTLQPSPVHVEWAH